MAQFVFDAKTFVTPGHETDPGEWADDPRQNITILRRFYPELSHWGDLAIGCAFGDMSEDMFSVSWANWLFDERHEFFLDYCCWRQTRGQWHGKLSDGLEQASEWRSG